jgi:hypothetical protein
MSITKVSGFSKDSFAFEDAIENKFGSKKIKLTASDQGPLLLKLEHCLPWGGQEQQVRQDQLFHPPGFRG